MLDSNIKEVKKIMLPIFKNRILILTSKVYNRLGVELLKMAAITEEQEKCIDVKQTIKINNCEIPSNKIYVYGKVNLNNNSKDFLFLEKMKLDKFSINYGEKIPNNYDYKEHCCYSDLSNLKLTVKNFINSPTLQTDSIDWITTTNIAKVIQYFHGSIGKPERICIFSDFQYTNNNCNKNKI